MKYILFSTLLLISGLGFGQESTRNQPGSFELGVRNTLSTFGSTGNQGYGFGGQFRIRLSNRINTEWFADYLSEDIDNLAKRFDYHIGWSVMFYPLDPQNKTVVPYVLAGHCFDYTKISPYAYVNDAGSNEVSRFSSATQLGLGTHFYLNDKLNVSLSSQYMIHLGSDIHAESHTENGVKTIHIEEDEGFSLEGHILFTVSLNYTLANLW